MRTSTTVISLALILAAFSVPHSDASRPNFLKALFAMGSPEPNAAGTVADAADDAEEPEECPGVNCPTGWCCPLPDWICCEGHAEYCASSQDYCP